MRNLHTTGSSFSLHHIEFGFVVAANYLPRNIGINNGWFPLYSIHGPLANQPRDPAHQAIRFFSFPILCSLNDVIALDAFSQQ